MQLNIAPPLQTKVPDVSKVAVKIIWCLIFSQQWNRTDYSDQELFFITTLTTGIMLPVHNTVSKENMMLKEVTHSYLGNNEFPSPDYQISEVTHRNIYCYTVAENQNTLIIPTEKNPPFSRKLIKK